jgi:CheY-like chemotaxis protein
MSTLASTLQFCPAEDVLLCVDDNAWVLNVTKKVLEQKGYGVLTASGGKEAIKVFRANRVDLVVLDYEMPGMKGHEVAVWIKSLNPRTPVVLHSGAPMVPDAAIRATDAFVPKGTETHHLVTVIANLLTSCKINGGPIGPNAVQRNTITAGHNPGGNSQLP